MMGIGGVRRPVAGPDGGVGDACETECPSDTHRVQRYAVPVNGVRHLLAQRHLAVVICAAALILKLLVPTGYMVGSDHGRIAIILCSGTMPAPMTMAMPGMHGDRGDHDPSKDHGKTEMPCAFAGLSAVAMAAIDPILLADLIVFVVAFGLSGILLPIPSGPAYLRPPLRGPPTFL